MPSALVQLVESSGPETAQHFSIRPFRLAVASRVSNGGKANLAAKVLDVPHEGVTSELRTVVGDDPVRYTKTTHNPPDELDC